MYFVEIHAKTLLSDAYFLSQILCSFFTFPHPLLQLTQIPCSEPTLERFWVSRQTCRNSIAR